MNSIHLWEWRRSLTFMNLFRSERPPWGASKHVPGGQRWSSGGLSLSFLWTWKSICLLSLPVRARVLGHSRSGGVASGLTRSWTPAPMYEEDGWIWHCTCASGIPDGCWPQSALTLAFLLIGCFCSLTSFLQQAQCLDPDSPLLWQASLQMKASHGRRSRLEGKTWGLGQLTS